MVTYYTRLESPVGPLLLAGDESALMELSFIAGKRKVRNEAGWREDPRPFAKTIRQLRAYFEGDLREFDLSLRPHGTEFQLRVWRELQTVPYGETTSYGRLAARLGQPHAARAVGLANATNPIPIIIPCHRVIGKNGSLTGFGGGLWMKEKLLALESPQRVLV